MIDDSTIRLAQLSDIHFHESSSGEVDNYRHSVNCLKKIQQVFGAEQPHHLVITGDITNLGDKLSLERAYQWINDRIYVDGEYCGLECKSKGVNVIPVPGNHDAFDAPSHGANWKRWQSSLSNFYSVFHEYVFPDKDSVDYQWLAKGNAKVFICRVDSCYLGDNETEFLPGRFSLDPMAKGRLSKQQSQRVLVIYDRGLRGELKSEDGRLIPAGDFMCSLKILVMHHYLFEPPDVQSEPLLDLEDKRTVFQNLAMSDFDLLLCGHKHIADVQRYAYLDHFDPRGRVRMAFNHVRRSLGISSLPLGAEQDGRRLNRFVRFALGFLVLSKTGGSGLTNDHAEEIIQILDAAIEKPDVLREELRRYAQKRGEVKQAGLFDDEEIRVLQDRMRAKFTTSQMRQLARSAMALRGVVERLGGRPFAQIIAGSSAKKSENGGRTRALNFYDISFDQERNGISFQHRRYSWVENSTAEDGTHGAFSRPLRNEFFFPHDRITPL
jgi:3',5'-cyclic AMP phosphodiesterase CpdA